MKTFVRLRAPARRRSDPRSRFRNRLLIGMVAVALLPLLAKEPASDALWIADPAPGALRTAPPYDVKRAVDDGRVDPASPVERAGHKVFADSQRRCADASVWVDPNGPSSRVEATFWTE